MAFLQHIMAVILQTAVVAVAAAPAQLRNWMSRLLPLSARHVLSLAPPPLVTLLKLTRNS